VKEAGSAAAAAATDAAGTDAANAAAAAAFVAGGGASADDLEAMLAVLADVPDGSVTLVTPAKDKPGELSMTGLWTAAQEAAGRKQRTQQSCAFKAVLGDCKGPASGACERCEAGAVEPQGLRAALVPKLGEKLRRRAGN
jgi:hypothetical protein